MTKNPELGQTLTTLETTVNPGQAMLYNANGHYSTASVRRSHTPNGQTVGGTVQQDNVSPGRRRTGNTTDNYLTVADKRRNGARR